MQGGKRGTQTQRNTKEQTTGDVLILKRLFVVKGKGNQDEEEEEVEYKKEN